LGRHVDVLLGEILRESVPGVSTLSWLPDFQHVHFPAFFTAVECKARDEIFRHAGRVSNRLIVMSKAVLADLKEFDEDAAAMARVVPIAAVPPPELRAGDPYRIAEAYGLPERFVYVPNQMWQHKNHLAALKTVKMLADGGGTVFAVFSGKMEDYRDPSYVARVLSCAESLGVSKRVRFLGEIPREHVIALMRRSLCVVNPSLFEGYGLSMDEARCLGKRVLVSDIPAHREQCYAEAEYFDPFNLQDFAEKLARVWREASPGPDPQREVAALREAAIRQQICAARFEAVVRETVDCDMNTGS
jgi:glycosyltransferase involved in cell wall biosynthesis